MPNFRGSRAGSPLRNHRPSFKFVLAGVHQGGRDLRITGDGGIPPRDAGKRGLTRVMTLGGAYGTRNYTVKGLRDQKGKRVLVETLPFSVEEAIAAEEAGIDTMKVRFDPNAPELAAAIRQAAPNTFMAFSVPLIAAAGAEEAVRLGYAAMAVGADAIMCQWSPRFVEAAAEAGIPVQGHAGLVPRRSTWTGGLRAVGKTLDEAKWVYQEIKLLENAGAYAVEVEVIPEALLTEISKRTSLMTSSIGGGSGGDIQFLFADDILGNNAPPYPRHSKQYRNLYRMKQEMQAERVAGFKEFVDDVQQNRFPAEEHIIKAPDGLIDDFLASLDSDD
jgi:3-methyl-2-oxobutanoate hydroxymethyltransferase